MLNQYRMATHDSRISLLNGEGAYMEASLAGSGLHCCGVGIEAKNYICPREMTFEELSEEFRLFDSGADYSFVMQEWIMLHHSFSLLPVFIKWIAVAAVLDAVIILIFFGVPENHVLHYSHILDTFSRFLPW